MKIKERIIKNLHPYEIVDVEFVSECNNDRKELENKDRVIDTLSLKYNALEIIEDKHPRYRIRRVKNDIGI